MHLRSQPSPFLLSLASRSSSVLENLLDDNEALRMSISERDREFESLRRQVVRLREGRSDGGNEGYGRRGRFGCFGKLPAELRIKIWVYALCVEEVVLFGVDGDLEWYQDYGYIWSNVQAIARHSTSKIWIRKSCREAKAVAKKLLSRHLGDMNPSTDIAWFDRYAEGMEELGKANASWEPDASRLEGLGIKRMAVPLDELLSADGETGRAKAFYHFAEKDLDDLVLVVHTDRWQKGTPAQFVEPRNPPTVYPRLQQYMGSTNVVDCTWDMVGKNVTEAMRKWQADQTAAYNKLVEEAEDPERCARRLDQNEETENVGWMKIPNVSFRVAITASP